MARWGAPDCDGLNVLISKTNAFQGKAHGKVCRCAGDMYGSGLPLKILRRFDGGLTNDVVRKRIDQAAHNRDIPASQPAIDRRGSHCIRKAQVSCYEALDTATAAVNEDQFHVQAVFLKQSNLFRQPISYRSVRTIGDIGGIGLSLYPAR